MKKFLVLAVLFLFMLQGLALAAPVTIADPGGQSELIVEQGAMRGSISKAVKSQIGSGRLYTGACRIQSIQVFGTTAGDYAGIYDTSAAFETANGLWIYSTETLEFELGISANTSSAPYDAKGAPFANGITILTSVSTVFVSVVFDY